MGNWARALTIGTLLVLPISALAGEPSASIPADTSGRWEGTAAEFQSIYAGPTSAKVTLDLKPDGTFTETWKEGARTSTTSGTWRARGDTIVLESRDASHARLALQRRGDALYTVAFEPVPSGRTTTMSIALHPAER
jgi:hypothetical protein